jgi:hypothetical protein
MPLNNKLPRLPLQDDEEGYYDGPTIDQIATINVLINKLHTTDLNWLLTSVNDNPEDTSFDFWTASWGRARDLIESLEEIIKGY